MVIEMDTIWLLVIVIFIAILAFLTLKDVNEFLAWISAVIAFIALMTILVIIDGNNERNTIKKKIAEQGLDTVVIDLYANDLNVKKISDKVNLTPKEVYQILRDNDIQ